MNQQNIISDLIKWIEKSLEQPLSIDNVAKKSGYSKWHLQRMFKEVTGQILGTYIRHRRLTHAALALHLTSKPILDIAMQYRFDSQQTFTRSFKKQFKLTPASYRRAEFWDPSGLTPPIDLNKTPLMLPEPQFVTLPDKTFWGVAYKNTCSLNDLLREKLLLRREFFKNYLDKYEKVNFELPAKLYAFSCPQQNKDSLDEQEIIYTIALDEKKDLENITEYHHSEGLYVCFRFNGRPEDFSNFISQIYLAALPALRIKRRNGSDIEVHYNRYQYQIKDLQKEPPKVIECDYYIPVITQHELEELQPKKS
ncbi:MDR efflux pump AcrAB transcriptional activator RobA [Zophobihabitans entericus]|uniref:MDR efflux pump AcrAB transcriptional activator RobA n=1 Tax=Zophobihabitans entericus TaxID=1635327 RepID=A0A6G9IAC5_9GAMM|nr:MDR efflux pump AcrAB transcriptional activator RobA [Zophobihabitans entericus]QIQ20674.1 MDR efflux pump AcrAB transcriptional activator RobA [Zophobihabitans entericus]